MNISRITLITIIFLIIALNIQSQGLLPLTQKVPDSLFYGNQLHIYIMAGQSNMAGRGKVDPSDTIINKRVISMDKEGNWVFAQEPLHHYEPNLRGLDCGKSFGEYMADLTQDNVLIGIIPCAVGGSSVDQWINDEQYRGVQLFSNFEQKTKSAMEKGEIKGIIWHQGESDARKDKYGNYSEKLEKLFFEMRSIVQDDELPIIVGELGGFWVREKNPIYAADINKQLHQLASSKPSIDIINTNDLMHKGDSLHFDGPSLRIMGERYGEKMIEVQYGIEEGTIRNQIRAFSKTLMAGNFKEISKMYTKDAKLFPPGMPIVQGTDPIFEYWAPDNDQNSRIIFHKVDPLKIEIQRNKAIDHGTYQGKSRNKGGQESTWHGKYIIVWQKVGEEWKIEMDIWNRGV